MTSKVLATADKPKPPNAGKGRVKGVPNKSTAAVKEAILEAFDRAGGVTYLLGIAEKDPKTFCALLGRILPTELKGDLDLGVSNDVKTLLEMIAANGRPRPQASV